MRILAALQLVPASVYTMRAHDELSAIAPSLPAPTPMPQTQAVATASPLPLEGPAASVDTMLPNSLPAPVVNDIRPQGEWTVYSHPQSRCPWWYCRTTGQSRQTLPPGWGMYRDPQSGRLYAVDEITQQGHFLP
jgi:hypothetical protein